MQIEIKYIISPITTWDDEQMLFATKLGIEGKNMPLHYTVWGKTQQESRTRTEMLAEILTKEIKRN
jgi:hypothetical protein